MKWCFSHIWLCHLHIHNGQNAQSFNQVFRLPTSFWLGYFSEKPTLLLLEMLQVIQVGDESTWSYFKPYDISSEYGELCVFGRGGEARVF